MAVGVARPRVEQYTKSFPTVVFQAVSTKDSLVKETFKAMGYGAKWAQICNPDLPANWVAIGDLGANGKNFISGLEIPKNTYELISAIDKKERTYTVVNSLCSLSNNVGDFTKFLSRHFHIPYMQHVEGTSGAFTLVGSINNVIEHVGLLMTPKGGTDEMRLYNVISNTICVITDLCYMVVGTLAVAAWLGLFVVPFVVTLSALSIALLGAFGNYFLKHLVNLNGESPDGKAALQAINWTNTHACPGPVVPVV